MDAAHTFQRGDEVRHIVDLRRGIVRAGPRTAAGSTQHLVRWGERDEAWVDAAVLSKFEPQPFGWASRDDFLADLVLWKFFHGFSDVLFSIGSSDTQFLVYQFKPVLQFIRRPSHGMLIADEVGLGKTIEAALILRELMARGSLERVLVVCPASLIEKWRSELRQRFAIELREMRARDFRELRTRFDQEGDWPGFFGVASLEGLRMTDFEETLVETGVPLDLVIVDEAHHLRNPATRSFALGEVLSDQADHILLLSATPIQTGERDLQSLLRLAEPGEFRNTSLDDLAALLEPNGYINAALARLSRPAPDLGEVAEHMQSVLETNHGAAYADNRVFARWLGMLEDVQELTPAQTVRLRGDLQGLHTLAPYYTRTRKREVDETAERRARVVRVPLTLEERRFYDAWVEFVIARARRRSPAAPPGWAITQYERLAASSLQAAASRLDDLEAGLAIDDDYEGSDPDPADDRQQPMDPVLSLEEAVHAVRRAAAALPESDSKAEEFVALIRNLLADRPERKILVFMFFKSTLRILERRLRDEGIGHEAISGDVDREVRPRIVERFREDPDSHVLLSTEVGSEGQDFQFCDAIVTYDLPWNPMRVEQQIGRIDRFGQRESQVVVASFFAEETIDTRILERLYTRIGVFEQAIGELEPILGPEITRLQADTFTGGLTPEEQERRAEEAVQRIERRRLDLEDLESARAELMGQGDLLAREVHDTRSSGRYVSPAETKAVLSRWLRRIDDGRGRLRPQRRDGVFELELTSVAINKVHQWMREEGSSQPAARHLLHRMQTERNAPWVTFEGELAGAYERLPFLHTGHPIVRTAIDELQQDEPPDWTARIGSFELAAELIDDRTSGGVALAVYRLGMKGLDPRDTLLPVAIALDGREELSGHGDPLLGALADAPGAPPPPLDQATMESIERQAFEYAERRRRDIEELERAQFEDRIAVRRATLRRSFDAKLEGAGSRLAQATNARIRRMYTGQVRNLEAERDGRIRDLEAAPEPSAEIELLSFAIFEPPRPS